MSWAATQKSSSRSDSSFERTARASPVQSSRPRMIVMPKNTRIGDQLTGRIAESASQSGTCGSERITSIRRWLRLSTSRRNSRPRRR